MDRNLGASRAATSAKDYEAYDICAEWGRGNDGSASITWTLGEEVQFGEIPGVAVNGTTAILSPSDTPEMLFLLRMKLVFLTIGEVPKTIIYGKA